MLNTVSNYLEVFLDTETGRTKHATKFIPIIEHVNRLRAAIRRTRSAQIPRSCTVMEVQTLSRLVRAHYPAELLFPR